jgi:RimJ/RimL family protein N-acetyltransferase
MTHIPRTGGAPLRPGRRLLAPSLYLEPPARDDMPFIRRLWADADTMEAVGGPIHLADEDAARWYTRLVDPGQPTDCYCLIRLLDHCPVGEISFHRLDTCTLTADLNVKVAASRRGRGIGREAMRRFLDFYFNDFGGCVIVDNVAAANTAGWTALSGFGFRAISCSPEVVRFELTGAEFRALSWEERDPTP